MTDYPNNISISGFVIIFTKSPFVVTGARLITIFGMS